MNQLKRKLLSMVLAAVMVLNVGIDPLFATAAESSGSKDSGYSHHIHDEGCGYTEEKPCTHEHLEECYKEVTKCVHEHTVECYPVLDSSVSDNTATPSDTVEKEPTECSHMCNANSGCITKVLDCQHQHDDACGYAEGKPCNFVAAPTVMAMESGDGWSFDDATGNLTITSNNGAANWYLDITDSSKITSIEIESPVTIIPLQAFVGCMNLLSVTIPSSVQRIEGGAFAVCVRLNKLTFLGDTPPVFESGGYIFDSCPALTIIVPTGKASAYTTAIGDQLPPGSVITDGIKVTEVKLNKDTLRFDTLGAEETLTATVFPDDATDKSITWDSTNPAVATVDANGKVKAIANGEAVIGARTADNIFGTCSVIVRTPTVEITTQPQGTSVIYGYTSPPTLSVEVVKLDGVPADKEVYYKWIKTDFPPIFTESNASYTLPMGLMAGTYSYYCEVSCDGYTVKSETVTVTVGKSSTTFESGITTYKGAVATNTFTYGDTITVKATPRPTGIAPETFALTQPLPNQMALFVGDTQISDPVNADGSGVYIMTYDTTGKALPIGSNTITAKYVGNAHLADFSADVVVILNKAILSVAAIGSHKYNGTNTFSPEFTETFGLAGIRSNDQVTALVSISVWDPNVGENKPHTVNSIELRGADKDFYSLIPETILYVVSITKRLLTSDMMVSVDDVTYNGTQHKPTQNVTDGNPSIIKPSDYTVSYGENINVGLGTVTITATESGNYYGDTYQVFRIGQSGTTFDGGIKTYKDATETTEFTYGDTITVKATPKATGTAPRTFALTPPTANQMALFVGNTQISEPVNADGSGVYIMTYDTTGKALSSGSNTITVKYVGNADMADFSGDVSVTLEKKKLTVSANGSRVYDGRNYLLPNFSRTFGLQGILGGDTLNALVPGTVPDAEIGDGKVFTGTSVEIQGADKDFYSLALSDINFTVAITKRPLDYATIADIADVAYNGTQHKPTVTVTDSYLSSGTIKPSDYTVSYGENINAGKGTVTITATESGNYSDSETKEFNITKAVPTVTLTATPVDTTYGSPVTLTATILGVNGEKPTGTVTFRENANTLARDVAVTNGSASYAWENVSGGDHSVSVLYTPATDGTGKNYIDVESSTITFNIAKANQSALSINEVYGIKYGSTDAFALSVTGGSGTGGVTYSVPEKNGVLLIEGDMAIVVGAGTVTVTASKAGDDNYNSITTTREITIGKASAPTITFPMASNITYGQKLSESTLTGGSFGYGSFAWTNGDAVPTVTNSGYEVTFTPSADTVQNYETITNTTDTIAVNVSKATPAVTVNAMVCGDTGSRKATLTATVAGVDNGETPTGTVKFVDITSGSAIDIADATAITITGDKATFEWSGLAEQIYKVKAVYNGSGNYNTATSEEISFDTSKKNQDTLSISEIGAKTYGDGNFTLSTNGGSGNGAVSYTSSDDAIISISGNTATIYKAGAVTMTATKAADNSYNEATASVSLIVGKKALTVTADDKLNVMKGTAMPTFTFRVGENELVGKDTFTAPTMTTTAMDTNTIGLYPITISVGTLTNADSYTITYVDGTLEIVKAIHVVTVTDGKGGGNYSEGQTVTITADSKVGYTFNHWSSSDGVTFANDKLATTTFTMPDKAVTVAANYSKNSSGNGGGNNNGGGGGGSPSGGNTWANTIPTIPTETKPDMPTTARVSVSGTVKDGVLTATITEQMAKDAIKVALDAAKKSGKEVDGIALDFTITGNGNYTNLNATMDAGAIDRLKESGVKFIKIGSKVLDVTIDTVGIAEIDKQSAGIVTVSAKKITKLSDAAKKLIGNRPVYDITISYQKNDKTEYVSNFGKGVVTLGIAYKAAANEKIGGLYGVYVDKNGKPQLLTNSSYADGKVIFGRNSLSTYGVSYKAPAPAFTDTTTHWAKDNIDFVASRDLISGTSATTFAPNTAITRADFLMALGRLSGADVSSYKTPSFTDVKNTDPAMPYIEWAVTNKIVQGIGNGKFGLEQQITREQMALMMVNYAQVTDNKLPVAQQAITFADDAKISTYAKDAVKAIQQTGVINGKDNNRFDPQGNATRAEASTILRRFVELVIDEGTARG